MLLEGIRDVFQEYQSKDNMLIFGGIHVVAKLVSRLPYSFASKPRLAPLVDLLSDFPALAMRPLFIHIIMTANLPYFTMPSKEKPRPSLFQYEMSLKGGRDSNMK